MQGIVTGIGFLGAGLIFRDGFSVRGLTSAASIWVTSAIGILIGIGFVRAAAIAVVLTLGALTVFHLIQTRLPQRYFSVVKIRFAAGCVPDQQTLSARLGEVGFRIVETGYQMVGEAREIEFSMKVWSARKEASSELARTLAADHTVTEFGVFPALE